MVDIHATDFDFFAAVLILVAVAGTMGYLLGRLQGIERALRRDDAESGSTSSVGALFLALMLFVLALFLLAPAFTGGLPHTIDGGGALVLLVGLAAAGLGVYYLRQSIGQRQS
jgi:hypothetical protein